VIMRKEHVSIDVAILEDRNMIKKDVKRLF